MFGKAEWFQQTNCPCGVSPVSLKGWLYLAVWGALVALPTAGLVLTGRAVPEAPIWLAFSGLFFVWDLRDMRRQLEAERVRNLPFIGDENESPELATRKFDLKLRG